MAEAQTSKRPPTGCGQLSTRTQLLTRKPLVCAHLSPILNSGDAAMSVEKWIVEYGAAFIAMLATGCIGLLILGLPLGVGSP